MLPLLYPDAKTRDALLVDPATAPIPALHRELFRFAEKFVQQSWTFTPYDLERLRRAGLTDADIVQWATLGSTQSWFTMSADGGGIPLEGSAVTGPAIGRAREDYEATPAGLLAAAPDVAPATPTSSDGEGVAWVTTDESAPAYRDAANGAKQRYGGVPNLFRAVSLQPDFYRRHTMALELLERPQTPNLSPRHHAMVRALVSHLNRSPYFGATVSELLGRVDANGGLHERLRTWDVDTDWEPSDRAVLALATKFARNTYKVTEKDAISLREVGLDDEAYVDILNTVSIQTSLDRLANALGVAPDPLPLLPKA